MSRTKSSSDFFGIGDDSEDDGRGSGSEDEVPKGKATTKSKSVKRRKLDFAGSDSEQDVSDNEDAANGSESEDGGVKLPPKRKKTAVEEMEEMSDDEGFENANEDDLNIVDASKLKPLTPEQLEASKARLKKTGVIYLSSIPPFMRPEKVRHLLSPFGQINRIFLVPEDPKAMKARVKSGGNKRKKFTEGWVEFANKKHARTCVETLNAQIVGGKKGNYYHDDVWNMKYLKGFKWGDLQAQIAYENASRQSKLRAEIAQATRENKNFLKNVERAKMVEGIQAKRKTKRKKDEEDGAVEEEQAPKEKIRRTFRQNEVKGAAAEAKVKATSSAPKKERSEAVNRVLKNIF